MRSDLSRLQDIIDAINQIEKYTAHGEAEFRSDELVQVWCIHHLQVIGEAARALSEEMRDKFDSVPWRKIIGMRHILVHHYFGVDLDIVWEAVTQDLKHLRSEIESAIHSME